MLSLAISKRVNLEGIYDGWGPDTYAIVTPLSYADKIEVNELAIAGKSQAELLKYELEVVQKHFVSGKGQFVTDEDLKVTDDITTNNLGDMVELTQRLFMAINGVNADPKDTSIKTE
jgi:hypothetical protein